MNGFCSPNVVYKDDDVIFTYHKNFYDSGKVLICFGEIGSGMSSSGAGIKAAINNKVDYLYVGQRRFTQYQYLTLETFKKVIIENFPDRELYLYGSSLGGYSALYYSSVVKSRALALSPRIPAYPKVKRFMRGRYKDFGFLHKELVEVDKVGSQAICFYDPFNFIDNYYLSFHVLPAYYNLKCYRVEGAGHYSGRALLLSGCLKDVVSRFLENQDIEYVVDKEKIAEWHLGKANSRLKKKMFELARENVEALIYLVGHTEEVKELLDLYCRR